MAGDLLTSLLSQNASPLAADPTMMAVLPQLSLAQAMTQEGLSGAPAYPAQALGRLASALVGGQMMKDATSDISNTYGRAADSMAKIFPQGTAIGDMLRSDNPYVRMQGLQMGGKAALVNSEGVTLGGNQSRVIPNTNGGPGVTIGQGNPDLAGRAAAAEEAGKNASNYPGFPGPQGGVTPPPAAVAPPPSTGPVRPPPAAVQPPPAPVQLPPRPATPPPARPDSMYTVKQGDTLDSIAKRFPNMTGQDIAAVNGLAGQPKPGMDIMIPLVRGGGAPPPGKGGSTGPVPTGNGTFMDSIVPRAAVAPPQEPPASFNQRFAAAPRPVAGPPPGAPPPGAPPPSAPPPHGGIPGPNGSIIPPLSQQSRLPYAGKEAETALASWRKTQDGWAEQLGPLDEAEQRLNTISQAFKAMQTGTWRTNSAEFAGMLKAVGIDPARFNLSDPAPVQVALHENYLSTMASLKAASSRWTQMEFSTLSKMREHPDMQPAANLQMLSEDIGLIRRNRDMINGWTQAQGSGWRDPNSFQSAWTQANPVSGYVDRARADIGLLAGMEGGPGSAGAGAANGPPAGAVGMLRSNPALRQQFDQKYGPGASAKILGQ